MDKTLFLDMLNELLTLEQRSLAPRLLESTVSVSNPAAGAMGLVQQMARATREHGAILANLILDAGGTPAPRSYGIATADLHFQDLQHLLPRLVAEEEALVRRFNLAVQRLSDEPRAQAIVSGILQQHRQGLQSLRERLAAPKVAVK